MRDWLRKKLGIVDRNNRDIFWTRDEQKECERAREQRRLQEIECPICKHITLAIPEFQTTCGAFGRSCISETAYYFCYGCGKRLKKTNETTYTVVPAAPEEGLC